MNGINNPNENRASIDNAFNAEQTRLTEEPVIISSEILKDVKQSINKEPAPVAVKEEIKEEPKVEKTEEKPKAKVKIKMKRSVKIGILMTLSVILIITGIYLYFNDYVNNPKVITKLAFDKVENEIERVLDIDKTATAIGDNFEIKTDITYDLDTKKYTSESEGEEKEKFNIINNLKNSKTTFEASQDLSNKKLYVNTVTKKGDKTIINDSYLIENSTQYYFVEGFLGKYINNGNNNYFEAVDKSQDSYNNMKTMYEQFSHYFSKNVERDNFEIEKTTTFINNKNEEVKKISLELTNDKMIDLLNRTFRDIKDDKNAYTLFSCYIDNFDSFRISKKEEIFEDSLTLNIYTKGIFNDIKKYELVVGNKKNKKTYSYEINNGLITLSENNKVNNYIWYKKNGNKLSVSIEDENMKKVGTLEREKTAAKESITYKYDDNKKVINLDFDRKISNKTKKGYTEKAKLDISVVEDGKEAVVGTVTADSKINNEPKIDVDVNDVEFKTKADEQKETLKDLLKNRLKKSY